MSDNWIEKATANNKGKFGAKAAKAGMSTGAYAKKESGAGGTLGKEANLAKTLGKLRPKTHAAKVGANLMRG